MKKSIVLLISALLATIVAQWLMLSRLRSENQVLRDGREKSEQSRSELEQTFEAARQHQAEAESLRMEVASLRAESQRLRQTLERTRVQQSPASVGPATSGASGPAQPAALLTDRNRALLEYMGEPVDPPLNMDARYTKEGLMSAVQLAAQNAGVSIQGMEVEDSEFPFLVGLLCEDHAYTKLIDELRKLDGYKYNGGVGGGLFHSLNITPSQAYPGAASEQIGRRLMLRQQVFYKRLSAQK